MTNRHLARSIAMQSLFEWDFVNASPERLSRIISENAAEFAPGVIEVGFISRVVNGVVEKLDAIDDIISKAAPEWPLRKIAIVDRNVLRIGLFELLFMDRKEVPAKVAINEAIELGKTFGGESSGKFINGVLGTVYKELGEPGKEETTKIKRPRGKNNANDFEKEELQNMPLQELAGGVVYSGAGGEIELALVHDIFGYWTLSKGKIIPEVDSNIEMAATRKIKEELGVDAIVQETIDSNEYVANDPEKGQIRKRVSYFLMRSEKKTKLLHNSTGLDDSRWFPLDEIPQLTMYNDLVPIITKAIVLLAERKDAGDKKHQN
ncbi:MAG: transcription antitermination factor NusB [Candidatus Vogelbacteria bacterium CG10_big_fil_rev_8_21_14_0_10_45_14]|uniref:Transcription antitermination protein NusB n=1 Tax=Candidatus Vogelbacteria bacterium CG10_big_fil_rev_8_21_14_0_10_45_14 TaxID=1975042 RepID=A0A2H0RJ31_9BACT|nr:MAG: transcription antitermination factor NusB [Candidatus Vogelbacteria bacterium CG10_big_fil_rev_8_21_14_0_10_45_14]